MRPAARRGPISDSSPAAPAQPQPPPSPSPTPPPPPPRRAALVTGCSAGSLGEALALWLLREGWFVAACARTLPSLARLEVAAAAAGGSGGGAAARLLPLAFDVRDASACAGAVALADAAAAAAGAASGGLSLVIAAAGVACPGPVAEVCPAAAAAAVAANVLGTLHVAGPAAAAMAGRRGRDGGRGGGRGCGRDGGGGGATVVLVGSVAGALPQPFGGVYAATKAAVAVLADVLRLEMRPFGVDVVLLLPGAVATRLCANAPAPPPGSLRLYEPWEAVIRCPPDADAALHTPPAAFADAVMPELVGPRPPARLWAGRWAGAARLVGWLPRGARERIVARRKGLPC